MTPGLSGQLDLFRSMQVNHQLAGQPYQGPVVFMQHAPQMMSFGVSIMENITQEMQLLDAVKLKRDEMPEAYHEGLNDVQEVSGHAKKKQPVYQRMKWTDDMVKLLITALSYVGEDALSNGIFVKKGKWRAVSCVMAQRGYHVSPQQCEDKFNDLNKKFKRLNDVLGRGTACNVVENPVLLEMMDLSYNLKVEVNKLLGSRQLFYQEMCSYNNRNRLFLPHDQEVQQSVLLAMRGKYKYETGSMSQDLPLKRKIREEERVSNMAGASLDCTTTVDLNLVQDMPAKRKVGGYENGSMSQNLPLKRKMREEERVSNMVGASLDCTTTLDLNLVQDIPAKRKVGGEERNLNMTLSPLNVTTTLDPDPNVLYSNSKRIHFSMNNKEKEIQDEHILPRLLQLEEQKKQIEAQILELEKQRFEFMRCCSKEDRELQKMMQDNEVIKLENQQLMLELKHGGTQRFD